jgi:hypothetical protein
VGFTPLFARRKTRSFLHCAVKWPKVSGIFAKMKAKQGFGSGQPGLLLRYVP